MNDSDFKVGRIEQLTDDPIVGVNAKLLAQATVKLNEGASEIRKLREDNKRLTESLDAVKTIIEKLIRTYDNRNKPLWLQRFHREIETIKKWFEENK